MMVKNSGFSLMEALIALAILGILMLVGIPLFRNSIYNAKLNAGASVLKAALSYARTNATKYNCYYYLYFGNGNDTSREIDVYRDTNCSVDGNINDPDDQNLEGTTSDPLERRYYAPKRTEFVLKHDQCNLRDYSFASGERLLIIKPDGTLLPADKTQLSYIGIKIVDESVSDNTFVRYKITNIGIAEYAPTNNN